MTNIFLTTNNGFNIFPIRVRRKQHSNTLKRIFSGKISKINKVFIYNIYSGTLYLGEIRNIKLENDNSINSNKIITVDEEYFIDFKYIKPIPYISLEHVYASKNKNNIGNLDYSISKTLIKSNYKFKLSLPIIDDKKFNNYININENFLKELVLYDNEIIPVSTYSHSEENSLERYNARYKNLNYKKMYGRLIEEDNYYIVTLTNKKMIELDMNYLNNFDNEYYSFYKPYFYEFIIDKENKDNIVQFISKIKDENILKWH